MPSLNKSANNDNDDEHRKNNPENPGLARRWGGGDPYSGKPFGWDESANAIVFTGLERGERGRHAILY